MKILQAIGGILSDPAFLPAIGDILNFRNTDRIPEKKGGVQHIHFLHGFLAAGNLWNRAKGKLQDAGFTYLTATTRNSFLDIKEQARRELAHIKKNYPGEKIDLVCHSQGGLVAFCMAMEEPRLFRSITTLGTPVRGSETANAASGIISLFGVGSSCRQMRTDSDLIKEIGEWLAAEQEGKSGIEFRFIRSDIDPIVLPVENAFPKAPFPKQVIIPGVKHIELQYHEDVLDQVVNWLSD